jgi:hypothetical protein
VTADPSSGRRRAWAWLAHLRSGGTTPWSDWTGLGGADRPSAALPGAQQLELLRRLNLAGAPGPRLVQRVLDASAAGRGSPDLELVGAAADSPFGPRPVDPGLLPTDELLRVATTLVAEELAETSSVAAAAQRRLPWRRGHLVVGDPAVARAAGEALAARGRAPGPKAPVTVVGGPLAALLADMWVERCFTGSVPGWRAWLAGLEERRRVPPPVDLAQVAARWSQRRGPSRTTVILDQGQVPRRLGVRLRQRPSVDAAELARRTAPVLGLMVPPHHLSRLLDEVLRQRLLDVSGVSDPVRPGVPEQRAAWVDRRARRMADAISRGDYAVVGNPRQVLPAEVPGAAPSPEGALDLAIRVLGAGLADGGERQA